MFINEKKNIFFLHIVTVMCKKNDNFFSKRLTSVTFPISVTRIQLNMEMKAHRLLFHF